MPLSEQEQKILKEIEAQLNATDPDLVEQVSSTTLYRHAWRAIKWAALGFVAGFVLLLLVFRFSTPAALVGFAVMLACLFIIVHNVRKLGKAGMQSLTGGWREQGGVRAFFSDRSQAWRDRFKRDDE